MKYILLIFSALLFSLLASAQKDTAKLTIQTPYLSQADIEPFWNIIGGRVQSNDGKTILVLTKDEWVLLRQIYEQVINEAAKRWYEAQKKPK